MSQLDPELRERIEEPASEEAEREARLTPAQATGQMRINVPAQRNRKLRTLLARVNEDEALKAYWHVSNVNAVKRLGINTTRGGSTRSARTSARRPRRRRPRA